MATYDELLMQYQKSIAPAKGQKDVYVLPKEAFVAIHFSSTYHLPEPWEKNYPDELEKALANYSQEDQDKILNDLKAAILLSHGVTNN